MSSQRGLSFWVKTYHQEYLHTTLSDARNTRARTYTDVSSFCRHLRVWTPEERRELVRLVNTLATSCWTWRALLSNDRWIFMNANNQLENGMPHTIGTAIVLPRWLVQNLIQETADSRNAHLKAIETLLHERVHVLQKKYPQRFRTLYQQWGYRTVPAVSAVSGTEDRIANAVVSAHQQRTYRTNPDTPERWVWREEWYPFVELSSDDLQRSQYHIVSVRDGRWIPLHTHAEYKRYHGTTEHCYHPDETSAVLLAREMYADVSSVPSTTTSSEPCPALTTMREWCMRTWS